MTISFSKYQGTGNDFVLIDDRAETFPAPNQALIAHLCHRRFGIGADGLILLQNNTDEFMPGPDSPRFDFRMVYFNADGAEGSMCGNGGRCLVRFAHDLGLFESKARFLAVDGEHLAEVRGNDIHLKMGDVPDIEDRGGLTFLHTGSPHVVRFIENLDTFDVVNEGRRIRHDEAFQPGGTNVNYAELIDAHTLFVRTFERGVEDETFSCGTGVTAVALAAHRQHNVSSPVPVQTIGGNLRVSFNALPGSGFDNVYLIGPAQHVFDGTITV